MFVICGKTRVVFDYTDIRVRSSKRDECGKTRVICDNLNVHVCINIIYKECAVFLDQIFAGVCSTILCIG